MFELLINQHSHVLLLRATLNPFSAHPVFVLGVALTRVQDLALCLIEIHEVHTGLPLNTVKIIPSLQHVNYTTQLGVFGKVVEITIHLTVHVANKNVDCGHGWTMRGRFWKVQTFCIRASHYTLPVTEGLLCLHHIDKILGLGFLVGIAVEVEIHYWDLQTLNSFTPCEWYCIALLKNIGHLIHPPLKAFPYQQHNHLLPFHSFLHEYRIGKNKQYSHFEEICLGTTSQNSNKQSQICLVRFCLVCKLCQKIFLYKWLLIVSIVVWGFVSSVSSY